MSVESSWQRIEQWYTERDAAHLLNPPASAGDVDALEAELGVSLPDDVRASLLRHDGTAEGGWPNGELLSVSRIVESTQGWRSLLSEWGDDVAGVSEPSPEFHDVWWHEGWVSLDVDGSSNGAVLDLAPTSAGTVGQILDMDHEVGPSGPLCGGYAEYLRDVLDDLASCDVEDDEVVELDGDDDDDDDDYDDEYEVVELDDDDDDDGDQRLRSHFVRPGDRDEYLMVIVWRDHRVTTIRWFAGETTDQFEEVSAATEAEAWDIHTELSDRFDDEGFLVDDELREALLAFDTALEEGDGDQARASIEVFRTRRPPVHEPEPHAVLTLEALSALMDDDWSTLLPLADELLTANPDDATWLLCAGVAGYRLGDEDALRHLSRGWEIEGDDFWDTAPPDVRPATVAWRDRHGV